MGVGRARSGAGGNAWGAAAFVALTALSSCISTPADTDAGSGLPDGEDASGGPDARDDGDAASSADRSTADSAGDAADDDAPVDAGRDAADGEASGDGGGDATSDSGLACAPVVNLPPPTCALYPFASSAVYEAYVPTATTLVTVEYVAPAPGGNTAYAIRFPCLDSPDVTCISNTAEYTFVPGAAGRVYVVGYGAAAPTIIVGDPTPPNATCATPTPLVLDRSTYDTINYGDSLPRFFSFTLPTDTTITVEGMIPPGTLFLHVYASCGGASLADAGAQSWGPSPTVAVSVPFALPAGTYILEADASPADGLSVIVHTLSQ